MPLTSLAQTASSKTQTVTYTKTSARASQTAGTWVSAIDQNGNPAAGALTLGANTTSGFIPSDALPGYPVLEDLESGKLGYITRANINQTVLGRIGVFDTLFSAGTFANNANNVLSSQPAFPRLVNDSYKGLEIWAEAVTAFTGNMNILVEYYNQDNVASTTGVFTPGNAPAIGRMVKIPLAVTDNGVRQIIRVNSTVATVGTFNIHVLRPLFYYRTDNVYDFFEADMVRLGMPQVHSNSALRFLICPDSTSTGITDIVLKVTEA